MDTNHVIVPEAAPGRPGLADPVIEPLEDVFVASNPRVGALSGLTARDLLLFHLFRESPDDTEPVVQFLCGGGYARAAAEQSAQAFYDKMRSDGWFRTAYPVIVRDALHDVYFTITRECDLACAYCYQGLHARHGKEMPIERVAEGLAKVRAANPAARIVLTGGEPLIHSRIDAVLDLIAASGLTVTILTNGTHLTGALATRIARLPHLRAVQVSLDGWSPATHEATRGPGSFAKTMTGIHNLIAHRVPFILAPTLHRQNIHELAAITAFAVANGGFISPNNLRHFPHDSNKTATTADGRTMTPRKAELMQEEVTVSPKFTLENAELMRTLVEVNRELRKKYGTEYLAGLSARYKSTTACSVETPNAHAICGFGRELVDIDWNGDVYPCHLAKTRELIIGNIFEDDFPAIFTRTEVRGLRVKSYEIPKCGGCKFVSNCGGGCRMGAYFAHGTLKREDDLCDVNYASQVRRLTMELRQRDPSVTAGAQYDLDGSATRDGDAGSL